MDIFPSIIDLVGYNKPINSWGRSLFSNKSDQPFSIHFSGTVYHFSMNEYNLVFDGEKVIGVYNVKDYALSNNIMSDVDYSIEERYLKAFYQDYMNRIIEGKLD